MKEENSSTMEEFSCFIYVPMHTSAKERENGERKRYEEEEEKEKGEVEKKKRGRRSKEETLFHLRE